MIFRSTGAGPDIIREPPFDVILKGSLTHSQFDKWTLKLRIEKSPHRDACRRQHAELQQLQQQQPFLATNKINELKAGREGEGNEKEPSLLHR